VGSLPIPFGLSAPNWRVPGRLAAPCAILYTFSLEISVRLPVHQWFAVLALLVVLPCFANATTETLQTASSHKFSAYVDGPSDAKAGIVLVHDWFGATPFYLQATERLAKQGYRVVAVDLYDGHKAATHDEAGTLMKAVDAQLAAEKVDAAIKALNDRPRRIAVMGFSMGAKFAFAASLRDKAIGATLIWYGETVNDADKLATLSGPALLVVGSKDGSAADNAAAFSKAADAAGAKAEIHIYPGEAHAFAQPLFNQGKTYDAVAAESAWRVSEDFLKRHLQ
jgi:carboxymethylenebutenolidase